MNQLASIVEKSLDEHQESKYGIMVTEMYLICLHPDNKNKNYQRIKVVDLSDEINSLFKLRRLEIC